MLNPRNMGAMGAAIGLVMFVVYLALIVSEGDDSFWEVAPWAVAIAAATGLAAFAAARGPAPRRAGLMRTAGLLFLAIGLPAIFSVGVPLILAGILCLSASAAHR